MSSQPDIQIKRVYDEPSDDDGFRVLIDRLWPRGLAKDKAAIDQWCKEIAPSTELRKWFDHDPEKFVKFRKQYNAELDAHVDLISEILTTANGRRITLLYAARDREHNHAVVLRDYLKNRSANL